MLGELNDVTLTGILFWLDFVFCLALAAGGMMLLFRFERLKEVSAYQYLRYYTMLVYIAGFYVLWSDLFLDYLPLGAGVSSFSNIIVLIGTPFLIAAIVVQLAFTKSLLSARLGYLVPGFLAAVVLAVWLYLYTKDFRVADNSPGIFSLIGWVVSFGTGGLLLIFPSEDFRSQHRLVLAVLFGLLGALYCAFFVLPADLYLQLLFTFFYFLLNTLICMVFVYKVKVGSAAATVRSFDDFVRSYGITSRESQIVLEIYSGKSNQQIADTLFVTLQTIKDHTSRIYQKTEVKSRAQLLALLREYSEHSFDQDQP